MMIQTIHPTKRSTNRGLTLIELLLSLTITAVIGMALTTVFGAVVSGVDVRRDSRSHIVRSYAAQSRLSAYIVPSRAFLLADDDLVALWFDDSRESGSVHASEIRWLHFDEDAQAIRAYFVQFPENWTSVETWLRDGEYPPDSNWRMILREYSDAGFIERATLVDGVSGLDITTDHNRPLDSRHLVLRMIFLCESGEMTTQMTGTLREHSPPLR